MLPLPTLLCPVRACRQPLHPEQRRYLCPQGHSFDLARSGYLNLLQPQDRRSALPGDSKEAVAARRRLHDRGFTRPLLDALAALIEPLSPRRVLDLGCGDGYYLGSLQQRFHFDATGIDISTPAIDAAARRYPDCRWLVSNADREIPCATASCDLLLSITARRNPAEFHRVLAPASHLLLALPAPDDLEQIRGAGRDRTAQALAEFAPYFTLEKQQRATTVAHLNADAFADVLLAIYRPLTRQEPAAQELTFSLDLLLLLRKDDPTSTA